MTGRDYTEFEKDFLVARRTEKEISDMLFRHYGVKTLHVCRNKDYDLRVKNKNGEIYNVEIKEDFTCKKTFNVGLEFECRGKPSGIQTTKATYYIYKIHLDSGIVYRLIHVDNLRFMIQNKLYKRIVNGGDAGSDSMNYLFPVSEFLRISTPIFQ